MGGHSHWAGIKHKKALTDAKRGKVWTKLVREITIAARLGGGNMEHNPRLRKAVDDARAENMPSENVKRAIQKGTGEIPGVNYEELTFEGYGPAGVAVYAEGSTDNRNRTAQQVRKIFEEHGGNMGNAGCVAFLFEKKGYLTVKKKAVAEDELMGVALDAGADDMKSEGDEDHEIFTSPQGFEAVREALKAKGIPVESSEVTMLPKTSVRIEDSETARKLLALIESLEEHDDVSHVYSNFDIPAQILDSLDK
ncbi:MAG: YebC/PmpR family DNA-binding transcriptional regulator [Elusimicrobiota bacterium]